MAKETKAILRDIAEVLIALTVFGVLLWLFLTLVSGVFGVAKLDEGVGRATTCLGVAEREEEYESAEEETEALRRYVEGEGQPPEWYRPDEEMAVEWTETERHDIGCPDPWLNELLTDSRGATAERWEIEECIRELMLEAGGESEADIREHAAVYCKRLLYTQTVGGFDDWGTTLYGVVHSHGFLETYPYIWTEQAEPTDEVREIFWDVWYNGYDSDFRVQNFRSGYYADWSIPAYQIGSSFYGINPWQDFSMFE